MFSRRFLVFLLFVCVGGVGVVGCGNRDVQMGAVPDDPESPLFVAIGKGDLDTVREELTANPAALNQPQGRFGMTPLHKAAQSGQAAIAQFLLENGAQPNAFDGLGRTPLVVGQEADVSEEVLEVIRAFGGDD